MSEIHTVIEAFADNEPVDPARLKEALATEEGRDHLVDVLVLRGFAGGGAASVPRLVEKPAAPGASRTRWLSAAAIVAAVSLAGGYYAGQQAAPVASLDETAPAIAASAPAPTRVIRLEDSADWIDRAGGD
jgi:hypothetical protein